MDLVNRLLSNGNSSRLNVALKEEQQKAVYVGAFSLPFEHPGLAIHFAIANAGVDVVELERAMDSELGRIQKLGVPEAELAKLKAQLETEYIADNSRVAGVANNLATAYTMLGGTEQVNTELDKYLAVTAEELRQSGARYLIDHPSELQSLLTQLL